ncbi:MAG: hypothetical protein DCF30_09245 [Hyphomicrobiales bacterium]|nr:MAG: hypothetical protein DCF30_09245 [Hyphomicrobiales bacterium]
MAVPSIASPDNAVEELAGDDHGSTAGWSKKVSQMSNQDAVIAKALNAGLRRLLVVAFAHQNDGAGLSERMPALRHALEREIKRLVIRGVTHDGEDVELTVAVRKGLQLYLDAAYREASEHLPAPDMIQ